jgi:hypothetical protein
MSNEVIDKVKTALSILTVLSVPVVQWFSLTQKIELLSQRVVIIETRDIPENKIKLKDLSEDFKLQIGLYTSKIIDIDKKVDVLISKGK